MVLGNSWLLIMLSQGNNAWPCLNRAEAGRLGWKERQTFGAEEMVIGWWRCPGDSFNMVKSIQSKRRQRMKELRTWKNFGWCTKKQECDLNIRMPPGNWVPCERMAHGADTITCSQTTSKSGSPYFQIFPVIGCQDQSWGKELGSAPASGWLGSVVETGHFCYWCLIPQKPCEYYDV